MSNYVEPPKGFGSAPTNAALAMVIAALSYSGPASADRLGVDRENFEGFYYSFSIAAAEGDVNTPNAEF